MEGSKAARLRIRRRRNNTEGDLNCFRDMPDFNVFLTLIIENNLNGKLSLTGNHKFYILEDNLELIKKIMDFNISVVISDYPKYGQSFLDSEAFKYVPDIRKLGITDITEDEFYKLIGFTHQEINQIKNPSSNEVVEEEDEVEKEVMEMEVKTKIKKLRIVKPKKKLLIVEDVETA